ncbi:4Fe-4S binding protein, partial [Candidatus Sumerlaeota bacterium]|nr:4Fe-4S binding protein [Candidatus Sumerlaeota bacterium]
DSALETAIALSDAGARVTICHRKPEFSRPKSDNIDRVRQLELDGKIRVFLSARVKEIREREVLTGDSEGREVKLLNDVVFTMIGREAPLEFFRRSGVPIRGEWSAKTGLAFAAFLIFCLALFNLKGGGWLGQMVSRRGWFPASVSRAFGEQAADPKSLMGVIVRSASSPSFYYTIVYSAIVVVFGIRRIRRRKTPYITAQTLTFMAIQVFPLFLLPEIIFPWLGNNGWIPRAFLDSLFPAVNYGHGREYWRAYGLILAWPLFIYNVFTSAPLWGWLAISFVQTFVIIPGMIYFWGKGAYCGWICSCGALAETLGDNHRQKMPHGPFWSRLNMAGQVILALALILFLIRVWGWIAPESWVARSFNALINGTNYRGELINPVNYKWIVDVGLSGVLGIGCYFWFSGRVWCRFFCPLAALMHIYARFSRFRILADKKKCISCNVCTSVCHQGIDVMNFANKGLAMEDPECVRCSACVHDCPTGVLAFGQVDRGGKMIRTDRLAASPVQMREEG